MSVIARFGKDALDKGFAACFGGLPRRYFSAPGRTELGGNHTDHQHGRVLAAAVDCDTVAAVRENDTHEIRVLSQGYPLCRIDLGTLCPVDEERGTTAALIRGVAAGFSKLAPIGGFDAYVMSTVLPGSGLSSSAAFEVLMGTVLNHLFCGGQVSPTEVAQIGQQAENAFYGKPCGLMDQLASAVGGCVQIDFETTPPQVCPVSFDFGNCGHVLCIINSGGNHENLTPEYAAVTEELKAVCQHFGAEVLRQVDERAFYRELPLLRDKCGDRAVLRAIHVFEENRRVTAQAAALEQGDFQTFLELVNQSGRSSWMYLQNVIPTGAVAHQELALTLALCDTLLQGCGACRVHGGGFAGTVQAFVPLDLLEDFRANITAVLGPESCQILHLHPQGGRELHFPTTCE